MRKLVCPGCGCTGDAEAFIADAHHKQALALALTLPGPVQAHLVDYLRLFSPPERTLTGARTLRLVRDLVDLVKARDVSHDSLPPRPCTPSMWADSMAEMVARKGGFKAHFTNHNYLRKIVYDRADQADARAERRTRDAERNHQRPQGEPAPEPQTEQPTGLTDAARAQLREIDKLVGKIGGTP